MFSQSDFKEIINTFSNICKSVCKDMLKEKNVESISYATVTSVNADGTYDVLVAGGSDTYKNMLNKSISTPLHIDDS